MQGSSSQNNGCSILPADLDTDHIFKQAEAAQILELSKDYKAKFSLQKPDSTRISVDSEKRAGKHGFDQSRSISNNISCSVTGGRNPTFQVKDGEVGQQDAGHQSASHVFQIIDYSRFVSQQDAGHQVGQQVGDRRIMLGIVLFSRVAITRSFTRFTQVCK